VLALAFVALSVLVALGVARAADREILDLAQSVASYPLDVVASLVTLLGEFEITGTVALVLALVGWRRDGIRGLVPLLLFVGVALEVGLKYCLPHSNPPPGVARGLQLLPLLPRIASPYSFPSGHVLRTTFLVALIGERRPRWRALCWALVVVMAGTRLYLNEHWLSDVVGGLLLGLTLAAVAAAVDSGTPT
jgi:undecaprenyl-diphosphatase